MTMGPLRSCSRSLVWSCFSELLVQHIVASTCCRMTRVKSQLVSRGRLVRSEDCSCLTRGGWGTISSEANGCGGAVASGMARMSGWELLWVVMAEVV